jgi:hypothetical protein
MIVAAMVLLLSCAAIVEFFVAYSRSIIASTFDYILSEQARSVANLAGNRVAADQFNPVMALARLCPSVNDDSKNVAAVELYFRAVTFAANVAEWCGLNFSEWADRERASCAFFAAVALDRRISGSRARVAEQMCNAL